MAAASRHARAVRMVRAPGAAGASRASGRRAAARAVSGRLEDRAQLAGEAGHDVLAVEDAAVLDRRVAAIGPIYARTPAGGVHDPHEPAPGAQPACHRRAELPRTGAGRA